MIAKAFEMLNCCRLYLSFMQRQKIDAVFTRQAFYNVISATRVSVFYGERDAVGKKKYVWHAIGRSKRPARTLLV